MDMRKPTPTVTGINMGCRLNQAETETMVKHARDLATQDTIIINTCAVTSEAVRQSRQNIRRARRKNPDARIIATGCAVETNPDQFAEMSDINLIIGNAAKLNHTATVNDATANVQDIMQVRETASHLATSFEARTRAFVEVQNGCDHRCTFCIIPYGRGNSRSAPAGQVVDTVKNLVDQGVQEVVLTGVDLTSWGQHLPGEPRLGDLVARILKMVPDLHQLRLSSLDAIEVDDVLFDLITGDDRIAPYLHLSLQAGDTLTLKRMKRRHTREQAVELCTRLKAARPQIAFGADLIAGFPTETDAMFQNTLRLIDDCQLAYVHAFPFSPRPGTPAARMPQVDRAVIKDRAAQLREKAASALTCHLDHKIGCVETVIMESDTRARAGDFTDIHLDTPCEKGSLQTVKIYSHNHKSAQAKTI